MKISLFGQRDRLSAVSHSTLWNRHDQVLVKDEVVFSPPSDPYRALSEASQRLSDGKSVFFKDDSQQPTQGREERAGIFSPQ